MKKNQFYNLKCEKCNEIFRTYYKGGRWPSYCGECIEEVKRQRSKEAQARHYLKVKKAKRAEQRAKLNVETKKGNLAEKERPSDTLKIAGRYMAESAAGVLISQKIISKWRYHRIMNKIEKHWR